MRRKKSSTFMLRNLDAREKPNGQSFQDRANPRKDRDKRKKGDRFAMELGG